jgi:hypothetical protein
MPPSSHIKEFRSISRKFGLALAKQWPAAKQALRGGRNAESRRAHARRPRAVPRAGRKFGEAGRVGRTDLSNEAARANVEAIRQMIAENDSWRELRKPIDGKTAPASNAGWPQSS